MALTRVKVLNGYAAHARFNAELGDDVLGYVATPRDIPSPYMFSSTRAVYAWGDRKVITMETRHRRYEVFAVDDSAICLTEAAAHDAWIASTR